LTNTDIDQSTQTEEWLRQSFLKVDEELRKPEGQNELGDLRRAQPPQKPKIL
jgi:hypothetical protein